MSAEAKLCAVTGANGFVGSCLVRRLQAEGWRVIPWVRRPAAGTKAVPFRLGQEVNPSLFKDVRALVHCAYDFAPLRWDDIVAVNVIGSQRLIEAAQNAGVESIVVISSLSAFSGCRSLYGRAKLQIESQALTAGGVVIRPGLVYGGKAGGMFGRLARQVQRSRIIPVLWGGKQTQYLVHEQDLGNVVQGALTGRIARETGPISVAHSQGWELKGILAGIASAIDKQVAFVPIPWQFLWLALKTFEAARVPAVFRSDSLVSIIYQDPRPSFELLSSLGYQCRRFDPAAALSTSLVSPGR